MIGVIANPSEHAVAREFFELFKTPWEFYQPDRHYEVLLCAVDCDCDENTAKLILTYSGQKVRSDYRDKIEIASQQNNACDFSYKGMRVPIYGGSVTFRENGNGVLVDEETGLSALHLHQSGGRVLARIGYDLFHEIQFLITAGQPAANAGAPTLELHIALLRDLIVGTGVRVVEIPPVPDDHRFIACLTHDVDHPSIRRHKFDHTTLGFLYRALFGSLLDVCCGRKSFRNLLTNWAAALKLPFVHLGLAKDFWVEFDRYVKLEKGLPSSFFVIPFEDYPGRSREGLAPSRRAARYKASDIAGDIRKLMSVGCEIGLHGIDAWLESSKGREELEQVRQITGIPDIGVRMHWLYFDEQSPVMLERAGAAYDSTVGYNQTVGFRAGTTQVYKPVQAAVLLELPLHAMDTALFFPNHLHLSSEEANQRIRAIVASAVQFGGCLTFNWHDRSIAPERLWGDTYEALIEELKNQRAWFATATQAVAWFRKRRSVVFEQVSWEHDDLTVSISVDAHDESPALLLRVSQAQPPRSVGAIGTADSPTFVEVAFSQNIERRIAVPHLAERREAEQDEILR
ncbi:MAG: hypothetical protein WAN33_11955 [Candidatus Acidiferrales bacterium]